MDITEGMTAVVIGGASGIGRATALELANRGCNVAIGDVHMDRAASVERELRALGRAAAAYEVDVRNLGDLEALRDHVLDRFGSVEVLVNSPGVALIGPVEELDMDDWDWILDINLVGFVRSCRTFIPTMVEARRGHIVNLASIAGLVAYSYDTIPYITSKFGCVGFTEGLAIYLRPRGIGVSVVCPSLVNTNIAESARLAGSSDLSTFLHFPEWLHEAIEPEEVGRLIGDAIETERFLVLTHPGDEAMLAARRADLDAAIDRQVAESPDPFAGRYPS